MKKDYRIAIMADMRRTFVIFLAIALFSASFGYGEDHIFGIGLHSQGLAVKVERKRDFLELRGQGDGQVWAAGLRGGHHFLRSGRLSCFWGAEGSWIRFERDRVDGHGYSVGVVAGSEYFFKSRFSAQVDVGPAHISLKDESTSRRSESVYFIANIGVNYYFGEAQR